VRNKEKCILEKGQIIHPRPYRQTTLMDVTGVERMITSSTIVHYGKLNRRGTILRRQNNRKDIKFLNEQ